MKSVKCHPLSDSCYFCTFRKTKSRKIIKRMKNVKCDPLSNSCYFCWFCDDFEYPKCVARLSPRAPFWRSFWIHFRVKMPKGSQMEPKVRKKGIPKTMQKSMPKSIDKWRQNDPKVIPKGVQNGSRNQFFIEKVFLRKPCSYYSKSMVLEVLGVRKSMTIHPKTMRKRASKMRCNNCVKVCQNGA